MSNSISGRESVFQFPWRRARERNTCERTEHGGLVIELRAARAREDALLRDKSDLLQRKICWPRSSSIGLSIVSRSS
jgi:hypothetical protein